jgi:hypothetical protein
VPPDLACGLQPLEDAPKKAAADSELERQLAFRRKLRSVAEAFPLQEIVQRN